MPPPFQNNADIWDGGGIEGGTLEFHGPGSDLSAFCPHLGCSAWYAVIQSMNPAPRGKDHSGSLRAAKG